jgi:hypothetical protein
MPEEPPRFARRPGLRRETRGQAVYFYEVLDIACMREIASSAGGQQQFFSRNWVLFDYDNFRATLCSKNR